MMEQVTTLLGIPPSVLMAHHTIESEIPHLAQTGQPIIELEIQPMALMEPHVHKLAIQRIVTTYCPTPPSSQARVGRNK